MSPWKVVGATVRGPDHEADGSPCQDAYTHRLDGDRLILALADGAGSARQSDRGARRLCDVLVDELRACTSPMPDSFEDMNETARPWIDRVHKAVQMVRDEFRYHTSDGQDMSGDGSLDDYAATLVAAVAEPGGGFFIHIGDGVAAALCTPDDWSQAVMSKPENGEYINETYFFTGSDWREHLRFKAFGASELIVAMTDGAMPFSVAEKFEGLEPRFIEPVTAYLDSVDAETGAKALEHTLDREDARRISGDDKTLVWVRRQAAR